MVLDRHGGLPPLRPLRDLSGGDWGYVGSSGGTGGNVGRFAFLFLGESETGVVLILGHLCT